MTYHISNFGRFKSEIPVDIDGYTHTDIKGWKNARMDWVMDCKKSEAHEFCKKLAKESRRAIKESKKQIGEWRNLSK